MDSNVFSSGRQYDKLLEDFGRKAALDINLGNHGNWLLDFLEGIKGFRYRMASLEENRRLVYEWHPKARINGHERHIAIMLFCMDSAYECLVFALNALGQAKMPNGFRDISDEEQLGKISPKDVTGKKPRPGWSSLFPSFQQHCIQHQVLIELVTGNHDVSKHRHPIFHGGRVRDDPPPGFFEKLGVPIDHRDRVQIKPMKEALIPIHPKLPTAARPNDRSEWTNLERVIDDFSLFIFTAVALAVADAMGTLSLSVPGGDNE